MLRPMAHTYGSPHNTLNFSRVEHLYKRNTVYLRPPTSCHLPNKFIYFLLFFTFFCCSRSSLYVCTFFSISFLNISQRDFEPNKKRAKAVLKNSLILFIVVCLVGVMFFLVKLFQFSHWMSTFCIPQPSNRRTKSTSGRSFSPSRSTSFAYSFLFHTYKYLLRV